ncbi:TonB-dependent receptor [Flavobacterium noncentrifugens]|uniref:Outer membrane receptor proteins, mostly Fe transport n=1 Tax=Flavobacterium noncentrifugens TaxID=1128970 RepID=A0A1G9CLW3_9FLAO|nr:TonB-dependent receptor [Flavobacterium noncentrifugens]GEP52077.1 TonB-dependent receptor [Flavobacterium noncentrifugens]SDK52444.1 Outer membrane receptor proteins, mostly Fe transport [Flavobacterium noncentrifugens]
MNTNIKLLTLLFFLVGFTGFSQTAKLQGIILDENSAPVNGVNVTAGINTTKTDENGFYVISIPANEKVTAVFTHAVLKKNTVTVTLKPYEIYELNIVMNDKAESLGEVTVTANNRKRVEGITTLEPATIRRIPGANAGVENLLKSLPGVSSNNELSTAYSVRGGNYDENLVYVNEIEVYRPFLIRSGQQEGLSFTNTDMVQNVDFSAGGFQAKYGDKLSSVLDITYRTPTKFGLAAEASFLGGSIAVDAVSKDQKWTALTGVRYRDNSLLVNSQETQTNFRPTFADLQSNITFAPSARWQFSFLGNISQNRYNYEPLTRETKFGTIDEPIALLVNYEGQEKDKYETYFGAFKTVFKVNDNFTLKFIGSAYHTLEQEYFDIFASYGLGDVDTSIGGETRGAVTFNRAIGTQLNHARNDLDAVIVNAEVKGFHNVKNHQIEWGFKYTREDIRDRIVEWEVIDSAGFSLNPPRGFPINDQPYTPYTGPLVPYQNVRAKNFVTINRFSGYAQWSLKDHIGSSQVWYNAGVRMHQWQVSGDNINGKSQVVFSPRAQFAIKPEWGKDMVFRLSGGLYYQPPFYRELRDSLGTVNPDVKAQAAVHIVLSNDYSFKMWNRPFKMVTEAYYKSLTDVNPYTLENVRIRYAANNNAKAFAQGLDFRLNGEFVPGTESWISFGYMKTEENINDRGYIARPTDQRLKFGVLFQDFMPRIPSVKLYLNLVYNTGLPGGSPSYADPYVYQSRLKDYRRADVGFSYVFTEKNDIRPEGHWLKKFKDLSLGFEIFNLFDNQNAITNTWVRDVYTKNQYGIPNYLTTRVFNVKLNVRL